MEETDEGSALTADGINDNSLEAMKALKMLEELEQRFPVGQGPVSAGASV